MFGTIDDLSDVKQDLQKALSISPQDSQIKRALRDLARETAKYKTASKKVYAKAFQSEAVRMSLYLSQPGSALLFRLALYGFNGFLFISFFPCFSWNNAGTGAGEENATDGSH